MNFEDATKHQLLTICLHENCPLSLKYEALGELEVRKWNDEYLKKLIKYWGMGYTQDELSEKLGLDFSTIGYYLRKYGLYGKRVKRA